MRETLFSGGTVLTVDPARRRADAVLVRGNRIVAVGERGEVTSLASPSAQHYDLAGRTLIPGFNEAHVHLTELGGREFQVSLSGLSLAAIVDTVREADAELPRGRPLLAFGWDYQWCPNPHRHHLDEVVPNRPVFLSQFSGHGGWANSAALERAGITPKSTWDMGGPEVDEKGELTGLLREPYNHPGIRAMRHELMQDRRFVRKSLRVGLRRLAEHGITTAQDNTWMPVRVSELARLSRHGDLSARVSCWSYGSDPDLDRRFSRKRFRDGWYELGPRKHFWDGAFSSRTAWLSEPYADAPQTCGSGIPATEIVPLLRRAVRDGRQVAAHAIGDAAVTAYLDAVEELSREVDVVPLRFRIEHAQLVQPRDVERIRRFGMVVSAQPNAAIDPEKDLRLVGAERARRAYPYRTLLDAGVPLAFGSDYPGESTYDPLHGIHLAVNRDGPERITAEEALACYTAGGAYAQGREAERGRIRSGFLADLVVLSNDPTAVAAERIRDISVDATVVDGRFVYVK